MTALAAKMLTPEAPVSTQKAENKSARTATPASIAALFSAPMIQRKAACACGGDCPRCPSVPLQTKLSISQPGDQQEQEADRIAGQVMRMPAPESPPQNRIEQHAAPHALTLQRKCGECEEEEVLRKERGGSAAVTHAPESVVSQALNSAGRPLPAETRAFFEPRFGHDFSHVRIHTDAGAAKSAQAVSAKAYTVGNEIVFNESQYHPHTEAGRSLLAHELVHVVQQGSAGAGKQAISRVKAGTLQRQTIDPTCAANSAVITPAWAKAKSILSDTIGTMESLEGMIKNVGKLGRSRLANCIIISFGEVGGVYNETTITSIDDVIERLKKINGGFTAGKNLRCDPQTIGSGSECDWRSAFVVVGNSNDIFLCPQFFDPGNDVVERAVTLIHEMAHSVLKIGHKGIREKTFPATFFDYNFPLELSLQDALRNAFAYEILANCMHGKPPSTEVKAETAAPPKSPAATGANNYRWAVGAAGGISVAGEKSVQGLAGIVGRLSLRPGDTVIFNPFIGLNVLYSPTTDIQPQGFVAGMADVGLRIQKPLTGPYLDISGGGFVGAELPLHSHATLTGGVAGSLGFGWRWKRVELGATVTDMFPPKGESDPNRVLVLTRVTARF